MKYWYEKPNRLLAEYVRTVLILEGGGIDPDSKRLPIFTNGMPALVCRTEHDSTGYEHVMQLALFGKSTLPECWTMTDQTTILAYFFKPFTLAGLFSIPVRKMIETPVDLCNWNPHKYHALRTQLTYADSTVRKTEVLDNLLLQQLELNHKECDIIRYATDQMMLNYGAEILSALLKKLDIKERTFQRMFKNDVGVTPTQYRRICQFQLTFGQLRAKQFDRISDVAFDNGFADQSHFIRSFKEFAQTTPNHYLRKGLISKNRE